MVAIDLPRAGKPLWNREPKGHQIFNSRSLLRKAWPRTYQAHFAPYHVDELGELIKEGMSKYPSY